MAHGTCKGTIVHGNRDDGTCHTCGRAYPGVFGPPLPGVHPTVGLSPADLLVLNALAVDLTFDRERVSA